jgi:hypothetical protein
VIHDIIVDTLFEENLIGAIQTIGAGRLIMEKDDPELPYLTPEEGYLIVRIKDREPTLYARELERRASNMRVVKVVDRTPKPKE